MELVHNLWKSSMFGPWCEVCCRAVNVLCCAEQVMCWNVCVYDESGRVGGECRAGMFVSTTSWEESVESD
jgi:hypothetical protein